MTRKLLPLLLAVGFASASQAQLINDGATIIVEDGATLIVETDIVNNAGSTLTNNGDIIVSGNMTNDGTFTNATTSKLRFEGTGDSNFKSSGATVYDLEIAKTSGNVVLVDDARVASETEFVTDGKIVLGDHDLTMELAASFAGAGSARYVDASGAGLLKKEYDMQANYTYPVGDNDDYSPIQVNTFGGSYAAGATIGLNVVDALLDVQPADATDFISRYWHVETEGITGSATHDLIGTYVAADVTGTSTEVNGFSHTVVNGLNFTNAGQAGGAGTVSSTAPTAAAFDFSGSNKYGSIALTAFLQGPLNTAGTMMTTAINGILPTTSPYTSGEMVASIPATDIVDWVEIEVRDENNNATVVSRHSAFLKADGSVVGLSGEGDPLLKDAPDNGFVALRHRNHLGVMADAVQVLNGSATVDFTNSATTTFGTDAQATVGTARAMRAGDVNGDGFVYYNAGGNDRVALLNVLGNNLNGFLQTYNSGDVNLDSFTYYNAGGNDRVAILNVLGNNLNGFLQQQLP